MILVATLGTTHNTNGTPAMYISATLAMIAFLSKLVTFKARTYVTAVSVNTYLITKGGVQTTFIDICNKVVSSWHRYS